MLRRIVEKLMRPRQRSESAYRFHLRYWFHPDTDIAAGVLGTLRPSRALRPEINNGPTPRNNRIVVIAPHPDDEVMGPGGVLLRALDAGYRVDVLFLSDGDPDEVTAANRRNEALEVANRLGFHPRFFGLTCGSVWASAAVVSSIAAALRECQAEVVLLPFLLDDNDEHRIASEIFVEAATEAGLNGDTELWCYQVYSALPANVLVPLGEYVESKSAAIRLYASQMCVRDWACYSLGLNAYNARLAPRGATGNHFEAFFVVPLRDYAELVSQVYR